MGGVNWNNLSREFRNKGGGGDLLIGLGELQKQIWVLGIWNLLSGRVLEAEPSFKHCLDDYLR